MRVKASFGLDTSVSMGAVSQGVKKRFPSIFGRVTAPIGLNMLVLV